MRLHHPPAPGPLRVTRDLARAVTRWRGTHDVRFERVGGRCRGWVLGPRVRPTLLGVLEALVTLAEGGRS